MQLPDDMPDEVREIIEGLAGQIPDLPDDVQIVGGGIMDASQLLELALSELPAHEIVAALVAKVGSVAYHHVCYDEAPGCECTPDSAWDDVFDGLENMIEHTKRTLRPLYDQRVEQESFTSDVEADLSDLEVADLGSIFPEHPDA